MSIYRQNLNKFEVMITFNGFMTRHRLSNFDYNSNLAKFQPAITIDGDNKHNRSVIITGSHYYCSFKG